METNEGFMMRFKTITENLLTRQRGVHWTCDLNCSLLISAFTPPNTHTRLPLSLYFVLLYFYKWIEFRNTSKTIWISLPPNNSLSSTCFNIKRGTYQVGEENEFQDTYTTHHITTKRMEYISPDIWRYPSAILDDSAYYLFIDLQLCVSGCLTTRI